MRRLGCARLRFLGRAEPRDHCPARADSGRKPPVAGPAGLHGLSVPGHLRPARANCSRTAPALQGMQALAALFSAGRDRPDHGAGLSQAGGLSQRRSPVGQARQLVQDLYELEFTESEGTGPRRSPASAASPSRWANRRGSIGLRAAPAASGSSAASASEASHYLAQTPEYAGRLTRFDLVTRYAPFSPESVASARDWIGTWRRLAADPGFRVARRRIRFRRHHGRHPRPGGSHHQRLLRIQILVPLAVLVVLVLILRRPLISSTWCSRCSGLLRLDRHDRPVLPLALRRRRSPVWTGKCPSSCS